MTKNNYTYKYGRTRQNPARGKTSSDGGNSISLGDAETDGKAGRRSGASIANYRTDEELALFVTRKRTAKLVVRLPYTTSTTRGKPKPQRTNMGNVNSTGRRSSKDRHQNVDFD